MKNLEKARKIVEVFEIAFKDLYDIQKEKETVDLDEERVYRLVEEKRFKEAEEYTPFYGVGCALQRLAHYHDGNELERGRSWDELRRAYFKLREGNCEERECVWKKVYLEIKGILEEG